MFSVPGKTLFSPVYLFLEPVKVAVGSEGVVEPIAQLGCCYTCLKIHLLFTERNTVVSTMQPSI